MSMKRIDLSGCPVVSGHLFFSEYSVCPRISLIASWASMDETSEIEVENDGIVCCSTGASQGFLNPTIWEYWLDGNMQIGHGSSGGM